ncbi:hypothetical protein SDRG_00232 [Saprolegnia diclina VS20]|uniref:Uncharacterized protein n=1 Tax=Saprolegnia diclina (strain VS20) TaxID=1156394 RepID=T0QWB7_SAPDV|nr:hypothetical protein SDRG_00232 [Saprolegnia diclina VS20]EQC42499.1 hypothetical protein SDRG_00232 [Saprolegnia diclina VS20]|eukprot:XP_008603922.1 hypothetical protein SDRG_00232 [Saprolegnia diclina VS20]
MHAVTGTEASELPPRGKIVQLSRSTTPVVPQRTTIVNLGGINKSSIDFTASKGDSTDDRLKRPLSDPPMPPAKIQRTLLSDMATGGGRTVYLADASSSRTSSEASSSRRHPENPKRVSRLVDSYDGFDSRAAAGTFGCVQPCTVANGRQSVRGLTNR